MKTYILFFFFLFLLGSVYGQQTATPQGGTNDNEWGFSLGILGGGELYIAEFDQFFDLESGLSLLGFYDFFLTDKFALGGNVNIAFPSQEFLGETITFYELALALKVKFELSPTLSYKPGFNLGYRLIASDDLDTIQGLGLNLTNELQLDISESFKPFVDMGFITQPAGGNDDFNTTFSPLLVLRIGIVFN
ncbi:MAG: hypothetical protein AAF717_02110 [Bacteroidota bacterium]